MTYKVEYTQEVQEFLDALHPEEFSEVAARIRLLKELGPNLRRPHADTLRDNDISKLRELRIPFKRKQFRVIYVFDSERNAILLVGGDKVPVGSRRWYSLNIERAKELLAIHERELEERRRVEAQRGAARNAQKFGPGKKGSTR